jgi:TetR/AcrR family tetracycline transcriptional repressor
MATRQTGTASPPPAPAAGGDSHRSKLSKATVVARALAIGDAEGLEALTIRRLAQELGVTPMALYWHFRNKNELLQGLAEQVWSEIDTEVATGAPWSRQLRGLLESLIQILRAHPCAAQLLLTGDLEGPAALQAAETAMEVLSRAGFDPLYASRIARGMLWTGLMLVMSEPGFDPSLSEQERAEMQRRKQVSLALLPPERYPLLVAAAAPMTSCDDPDFHYALGADLYVAGVEALAARVAAPQPGQQHD